MPEGIVRKTTLQGFEITEGIGLIIQCEKGLAMSSKVGKAVPVRLSHVLKHN